MTVRILLSTLAVILSFTALPAVGQLQLASTLYQDTRPISGETGTLKDIAASRECFFVSWVDSDGDHWLDTWRLGATPEFVEGHPFGNMFSDQGNLLPVAHLKSPRDMIVTGGRLIFWSLNEIWEASLLDDCRISEFQSANLADARNNVMNRFSGSGSYAATRRTFLSDQEFTTLLGQGVPIQTLSDEQVDSAFVNFQIAGSPFIVGGTRNRGGQSLAVGDGVFTSLGGKPAMYELSDNLASLKLTEYKPARASHIDSMWKGPIGSLFRMSAGDRTLRSLLDELFADGIIAAHADAVLQSIFTGFGHSLSKKLPNLLQPRFKKSADIKSVLRYYRISESATVKVAVDKIVQKHLNDLNIDELATRELSARFGAQFLGDVSVPISQVAGQISGAMDNKLAAEGLEAYIVNTVLKPLVDSPDALSLKLDPFLDAVTSNPASATIDAGLSTFHTAIPLDQIPDILDFDAPECLTIPGSTRNLVELAFVQSGPKLNPDGLALFEVLKLGNFYLGSGDFSQLTAELDSRLRTLHGALGLNAAQEFYRSLNLSGDISLRPIALFGKYFTQVGAKAQLSNALSEAILKRLESKGIRRTVKVRAVLKQISKGTRRSKVTVQDFQKWMGKRALGVTLAVLAQNAGARYSLPLAATYHEGLSAESSIQSVPELKRNAERLLKQLFGSVELDWTLNEAVAVYINTRISPKLVGDFVSQSIGGMLEKMANDVALPSVFGQFDLAARGDCIAKWRLAYTAAAGTAASLGLVNTGIALSNSELGLSLAIDTSIQYFLDGMVGRFLSEIIGESGGHYPSWHLRLRPTERIIDLAAAAGRTGRLVDVFSHRNRLVVTMREMGASFPDAGGSRLVSVVLITPDGSAAPIRIDLDGWSTVSALHQAGDYLVMSGQRVDGPIRSILALDLSQTNPSQYLFEGNDLPPSLTTPIKVLPAEDGRTLIVASDVGGLSILSLLN